MHPKFGLTRVQTHHFQIMNSAFHVPDLPLLTLKVLNF